jgi:hypothetical protein
MVVRNAARVVGRNPMSNGGQRSALPAGLRAAAGDGGLDAARRLGALHRWITTAPADDVLAAADEVFAQVGVLCEDEPVLAMCVAATAMRFGGRMPSTLAVAAVSAWAGDRAPVWVHLGVWDELLLAHGAPAIAVEFVRRACSQSRFGGLGPSFREAAHEFGDLYRAHLPDGADPDSWAVPAPARAAPAGPPAAAAEVGSLVIASRGDVGGPASVPLRQRRGLPSVLHDVPTAAPDEGWAGQLVRRGDEALAAGNSHEAERRYVAAEKEGSPVARPRLLMLVAADVHRALLDRDDRAARMRLRDLRLRQRQAGTAPYEYLEPIVALLADRVAQLTAVDRARLQGAGAEAARLWTAMVLLAAGDERRPWRRSPGRTHRRTRRDAPRRGGSVRVAVRVGLATRGRRRAGGGTPERPVVEPGR